MSLRNVRILLLVLIALEVALLVFGPQALDHLPAIQAALAAKAKPPWWDDAAMGVRYAAWINLALLATSLLTARWWARPSAVPPISSLQSPISNSKWFWPLAIVAVITCFGLRLPLASKSLWWDEAWVVLQASHGKWNPNPKAPDSLKFQAHDWKRCAFYYQKPTNHVPMSLAQKASFNAWRMFTGARREDFSDLAARTPALIASCAAVLLLALLLRSWGWPGAGAAAAFLLALHPWHVRYGVDARAYALVVPLCIGGMFAVSRIWQTRGAAILPWACWGFIECLWLWAYPNAVLDITVLNVALALVVGWRKETRATGLIRLLVTNLFAAMVFVQLFLPNVMQALRWAGSENVAQPVNVDLLKSTLSQLIFGVEYAWPRTSETVGLISSASGLAGSTSVFGVLHPRLAAAIAGWVTLLIMLAAVSQRQHFIQGRARWVVMSLPIVSSIALVAFISLNGSYFYPRFVIAALPALIGIIGMFVAGVWSARPAWTSVPDWWIWIPRSMAVLGAVVMVAAVAPFWLAQDRLLIERPYAPLRDVTKHVRAVAKDSGGPGGEGILVCYGHGHEVMPLYVPQMEPALSRADLEKFIVQARAEQRPLLVVQGHSVHNRAAIPDGFTLLDDRNVFEELKAFPGIEPEFYFRVFRLK